MNNTALSHWRVGVARLILCTLVVSVPVTVRAQFALQGLLGDPVSGFAPVIEGRTFQFPRDHGAHPGFRTEWWYATGMLVTKSGRRFGLQLTLFRYALAPTKAALGANRGIETDSAWRAKAIWMGHMAISDVRKQAFHNAEVFARGARAGAAGATVAPVRIWLHNWAITSDDEQIWRLAARHRDMALAVRVQAQKPVVLQGHDGFSRKSAGPHAASYYYALTRLRGDGQLQLGEERFDGNVQLWLDREWSSSALSANQVGWDWLGLQLDDGRDLMLYRLRNADGSVDRFSAGALVAADGARTGLAVDDFELLPEPPHTLDSGRRYPLRWRVRVPGQDLNLTVTATFPEQEHTGAVAYWEGLVEVLDASGKAAGHGYLEMTGY